jgi:hypothetical protein
MLLAIAAVSGCSDDRVDEAGGNAADAGPGSGPDITRPTCFPCSTLGLGPNQCTVDGAGLSWSCNGACLTQVASCPQDAGTTGTTGTTDAAPPTAKQTFPCTGAGIAAFADALVGEVRQACTSSGVGVVTNTNYSCMRDAIYKLATYPDVAYARVTSWAQNGNNYAGKTTLWQCVEFAFIVTGAVCGSLINNGDAQIDVNMQIPGYTYMNATPGGAQAGDVLVMYGHIAITAQVLDATHVRVAEANCLNVDGTMGDGTQDTGVVSNTRTDTLGGWNAWILGWYRKN